MNQAFFSLLLPLLLVAPAAPAQTIGWEELASDAIAANPSLRSGVSAVDARRSDKKASVGAFFPAVSLNAKGSRSSAGRSGANSTTKSTSAGATASLNLFNGFSSVASLRKAGAGVTEAEAARDLASSNLRYDLRSEYFTQFIRQERVKLSERIVKRQQQDEKLLSLKYSNGSEARWNYEKSKAELEQAVYNLHSALLDLKNGRKRLARLIATELPETMEVAAPKEELYGRLLERARFELQEHPQYRQLSAQYERADRDVTIARSNFFPSVNASYSYDRTKTEGNPEIKTGTALLSAEWSIFSGLADFYKVQSARAARDSLDFQRDDLRNSLRTDYETALEVLGNAVKKIPIARAIYAAALERYNTVNTQYKAGLKNYLEWEQAESQLLQAEQDELAARSSALSAAAVLEKTMGLTLESP